MSMIKTKIINLVYIIWIFVVLFFYAKFYVLPKLMEF